MKHKIILSKMLVHAEKVQRYCIALDYDAFLENDIIMEACVFNLSQIGELAGKTNGDFRDQYPQIKWNQIRGLRNRIVHDYDGVNRQLIWEIIQTDIPKLISDLKRLQMDIVTQP